MVLDSLPLHVLLELVGGVRRPAVCDQHLHVAQEPCDPVQLGLHLVPAGVLADLDHRVLGVLVDEGVEVVLPADRALVVGVHLLPCSVREHGWLERLLLRARHGGEARPAGADELVDLVSHAWEPACLTEQPQCLVLAQVSLVCQVDHRGLELPGDDHLVAPHDDPLHLGELGVAHEAVPAHAAPDVLDHQLELLVLVGGQLHHPLGDGLGQLVFHHAVDVHVQVVLDGLVLLLLGGELLLGWASGSGSVIAGVLLSADVGDGEAVAGELHPVPVHPHLLRPPGAVVEGQERLVVHHGLEVEP